MFPAAQKTFKTKQKYSTNNNLGKRLHFFFDKNKTLSIIILASLILCLLSFTFLHLRRVQPNSNIRSLASHSKAILENKNPNFNVFFGERNTPDKQWVRFEAKASSENPFEESQKGFFGQILDTVRPKRVLGIELSLEQAGTEKVKTSTEFIENVEPKEGDNPYTSSQKPHVLNTDVVDGIDIEYQILEGLGLKEDIIIKDLDLYTKECEDITTCDLAFNEFVFNLKLDDGLILKRAWYTYKGKNTETYYFTDEKGNYIGHFLPSWAIDSNGAKTHYIDIKVEEEKGNLKVKVVIDNDWLFSEERIFPIRIDPTIVHDTEIDFGAGSFVNTEIRNGPELGLKKPKNKLIDSNTVGYWTLDETGGSGAYLLDSSGNNNHGTPTGTTYTTGKIGGARSFDGSSYITVPSVTAFSAGNTVHSIEMWISPASTPTTRQWPLLLGAATTGNYHITYNANGNMYLGPWGGNQCSITPDINKWNHIVTTFDGSVLKCYKNGVLSGSNTTSFNFTSNALTIAKFPPNTGEANFIGVIDSLRISTGALPSEEIMTSYLNGLESHSGYYSSPNIDFESNATLESLSWTSEGVNTGDGEIPYNDDGLVAQWNFNNTSGTTLTNNAGSCGTSCNATLSNFSNTSGQDVAIGSGWTNIHRRWGNGALMFDGVDDYATLNSNSSLRPANNFSVEAWVKVSNNTDFNIIITHADNGGGDDGWTLRVADTGRAQFYATNLNGFSNQNIQSNTLIELNEWYYLVGVYDNSVLKIYVNGILDNTKIAQGDVRYEVTDYVTIGRRGGTASPNTQFFHGTIDVIRFSQRVLSPSEILSNYQAGNIEFQYRDTGNSQEEEEEPEEYTAATGGTVTYYDDYTIHTFTSDGTFETNERDLEVELLVVGGGGGGGLGTTNTSYNGGGGGAGGLIYRTGVEVLANSSTSIVIGAGGTGSSSTSAQGGDGEDSSFGNIVADGGGGGGSAGIGLHIIPTEGNPGGSGGGGAVINRTAGNGGSSTQSGEGGYGNNGSGAYTLPSPSGGGGGGAGSAGSGYSGGSGKAYSISGTSVTYAKGGTGDPGDQGGIMSVFPQTPNMGHGGDASGANSWSGSSGIVIVRYLTQYTSSENEEGWVGGSEEVIDNFENNSGWQTTDGNTLQKDSTEYSIEGSYALKLGGGYNIDANTVGYWTLDETGGNLAYIKDYSGNNNHGTPTGTTYTTGKIGGARSFNGSSDRIITGTSARPSNNFTVETWFTTNVTHEIDTESTSGAGGTSGQKYLFGAMNEGTNAGMGVSVGTNGISVYEHGNSYMPALAVYNGPVPVGWNHLAVTYINKTPRIYLNGKLVRTGLTSTKSNIYAPYHIGGGSYGNHSGDIDEVRISNIARTPEEIAESYRLGKDHYVNKTLSSSIDLTDRTMIPFWVASDRLGSNLEFTYGNSKYVNNQPDANTVGLWRLDEESGSGAYLLDSSGNNNHGTPTGTTYTTGKIGGARSFNGSSVTPSYITMLRPSGVNNVLTVSLWFKTASTARGVLVDFSDSQPFNTPNAHLPILLIQSDGKIRAEYWTGTLQDIITSSTIVNDGNWHHISFVGNTSSQSLYIDGRLEGTRSGTIDNSWWIYTSLGVGYDTVDRGSQVPNSWNTSYNGLIDEFHISNIARTPTEIRQAYEMGRRTHPIVVTFNANLKSTNLITGDDDLSFDITTDSIENIDKGEKIIIKENYNGTEYIAQGDIETINKSTGAITVSSWDSGSTSPHYGIHSIGFSTNATVFKWQKEYIDIRFPLPEDKNNISQLTFRKTTNEGTTFWIDDMKKAKYLTDSSGSTFEEVKNIQEAQYKSIFTTWDKNVSSDFYLTSVILDYTDNDPPTAPTDLLTQGQTNPIRVSTPYFSAIFNDPDTGDTGVKYQIQVNTTTDFSGALIWDSGIKTMTATSVGARSPNLTYAGTALPMDGTTYYWRIKFVDYGGLESPWSSTAQFTMNRPPTAPTDLLTQGQTNPIRISTPTPYFSAIFNDLDTGDTGVKYQIQVNTTGNFSGALIWDSGIKTMTATSVGARSPNITYAGAALPMDGTIYYWRIKFVDYGGLESLWSSIAQFTMNNSPSVPTDLLTQGQTNPLKVTTPTPYFSAIFNDPDTGDTGIKYQIQVNVQDNFQPISMIWDSGIKTMTATSVGARSPNITYAGTTLPMDGTKYYWRIKFIDNGGLESPWSSTISTDYFILSGIPTASDLQTDGMTNPTSVLKPPSFSAIYNDPNNDNSSYYQIQVNTTSNFLGTTMWDSGKKVITLSPGTRSPWIPYAGTNLNYNGTKYYVRMKFWDNDDNESTWVTGNFTDNPGKFQLEGLKLEGLKID